MTFSDNPVYSVSSLVLFVSEELDHLCYCTFRPVRDTFFSFTKKLNYMHVFCFQENLDKQTQHAQTLAEKLWLAERQLEDVESDKESKDKKLSDLSKTILRLETEVRT